MKLFHIDTDKICIKGNIIELFSVPELVSQLRKVLRIKKGDKICIQFSNDKGTTRLELSILDRTDQKLNAEIISQKDFELDENNVSMLIAMPNKREKAELIVQKLTEIGIQNIYFRISEHSIIRQRNDKKAERLNKISREAVEQSRGIQVPKIKFLESEDELKSFVKGKSVIIANMNGLSYGELDRTESNDICGVIGPEGGFSEKDLILFNNVNIVDLGNNVLRMETASIVLARLLKNT